MTPVLFKADYGGLGGLKLNSTNRASFDRAATTATNVSSISMVLGVN